MKEEKGIKIAVIGAGNHSTVQHGPALKAYANMHPGRINLSAVCDLDIGKAKIYAKSFGFSNIYDNMDAMIDKETPDGLIVVTPMSLTKKIAGELLGKGIPLMIEKPPGKDSSETLDLLKIAENTGTPHMISFNRRFSPAVLKARDWIKDMLPERKPRIITAKMVRTRRIEPDFATGTGIHLVDNVLSFTGRPIHVSTEKPQVAGSYSYISRISCDNGIIASIIIAPCSGASEETYEIYGDEYLVHIDFFSERIIIYDKGVCVLDWTLPSEADPAYKGGCIGEVENFVEYIMDKKEEKAEKRLGPDLKDGLFSMLASEAVMAGGCKEIALPY